MYCICILYIICCTVMESDISRYKLGSFEWWMVFPGAIISGNYQNILYLLSAKYLVTLQNDVNLIAVRSIDYLMANSVVFAQTH